MRRREFIAGLCGAAAAVAALGTDAAAAGARAPCRLRASIHKSRDLSIDRLAKREAGNTPDSTKASWKRNSSSEVGLAVPLDDFGALSPTPLLPCLGDRLLASPFPERDDACRRTAPTSGGIPWLHPPGKIIGVFVRSATAYGGTETRKRVSVTRMVNTMHPAPLRKSMRLCVDGLMMRAFEPSAVIP
jgi:hypothetical protein